VFEPAQTRDSGTCRDSLKKMPKQDIKELTDRTDQYSSRRFFYAKSGRTPSFYRKLCQHLFEHRNVVVSLFARGVNEGDVPSCGVS
jgi:hypothetical protein